MSTDYQQFIDQNDPKHYAGSPFERKRVISRTQRNNDYDNDDSLNQEGDQKLMEINRSNQRKTSAIEVKQRLSLRCSLASLDCNDNDDISEQDTCCSDQGSIFCCEQFESRIFSWIEANVPKMVTPDDKRQEYFAVKRISVRNQSQILLNNNNSNNLYNQLSSSADNNQSSNNQNEKDLLESQISSKFQGIPDTLETNSKFKRLSDPCSVQTQFELPGSSSLFQRRQSQKNSNFKTINNSNNNNSRNHNNPSLTLAEMKNNLKLHHSHTISECDH